MRRCARRSAVRLKYLREVPVQCHPQPRCAEGRLAEGRAHVSEQIETLELTVCARLHSVQMLRRPCYSWALEIGRAGEP